MRRLFVYVHPSRRDWAHGHFAALDIEDELEHVVILVPAQQRDRVFVTDRSYDEMERSLDELRTNQPKGDA